MATCLAYVMLVLMTSSVVADRCSKNNCKPPNCRCWEDRSIPGNLANTNTPQIVLISFGNSINRATKGYSEQMMQDLENPNGCPAMGTFFIEHVNTDPREVKKLYDLGYEIGLSTMNDTIPKSSSDWLQNIGRVKAELSNNGIPASALKGVRSPQLYAGGDEEFDILAKLGIKYDTTCVNRQYNQIGDMLWPYTYDFPEHAPLCTIGKTPQKSHNGSWQFVMADLKWGNRSCPSPSACSPDIKTAEDTFQFLFSNFLNHYDGNRAPFNLYLDSLWLTDEKQARGTKEFLTFLGALSDTWLLTFQQALDWMREPCDKKKAVKFPMWGCGLKK